MRTLHIAAVVEPIFFRSSAEFRRWLEKNHDKASEVWLGFYKATSASKGITYKEALDEALCLGWIDGVRKRADAQSYVQRFSPRKPKSYWSAVNTKRAEELKQTGRMHPAGLKVFENRDPTQTARYSFERQSPAFDADSERRFRANKKAWAYFESEAPWYRRVTTHWVTSAKREETRRRRLETLIDDCAAGRRIAGFIQKK